MRLSDPFENQYSKNGIVPKLESVHGIALYDPVDGQIVHMHTILNFEGASPVDPLEKEREVLEFAGTELNFDVTKLSIIHDRNLKDISANYYVNVREKKLVKVPNYFVNVQEKKLSRNPGSEIQKRVDEPQKQSDKD